MRTTQEFDCPLLNIFDEKIFFSSYNSCSRRAFGCSSLWNWLTFLKIKSIKKNHIFILNLTFVRGFDISLLLSTVLLTFCVSWNSKMNLLWYSDTDTDTDTHTHTHQKRIIIREFVWNKEMKVKCWYEKDVYHLKKSYYVISAPQCINSHMHLNKKRNVRCTRESYRFFIK